MLSGLGWCWGLDDTSSGSLGLNIAVALMETAITPLISIVLEKRRTILLVLLSVLLAGLHPRIVGGFQLTDSPGEGKNSSLFVPYEQGFVGRIGDPFTTYTRIGTLEGAEGSDDMPRMFDPPATSRE